MGDKKTIGFVGGKFIPLHQGHVYLLITASNMADELYVILSSSKRRDKELCKRDGIDYIQAEVRLSWIGECLKDIHNAKIVHIEDDYSENDYNWEEGAAQIKKAIQKPIDFVFSSEPDYNEYFKKLYPNSRHILIDPWRKIVPVSATEVRRNLYKNWDQLPIYVRSYFTKKIAIVGTESCGKTTLAQNLAKFYNTVYVEEVGRKYCEKYSNQLLPKMFDFIAMEHCLLRQKKLEEADKLLFIDSDGVITQYYLDMYFKGEKSELIEHIIKLQDYDLVIYLEPDVNWIPDGLRFAGQEKERINNNRKLKKMYKEKGIKIAIISGNYNERFEKARNLINELLNDKK